MRKLLEKTMLGRANHILTNESLYKRQDLSIALRKEKRYKDYKHPQYRGIKIGGRQRTTIFIEKESSKKETKEKQSGKGSSQK